MEEEFFRSGAGISISRYLVSRFLSTSDMLDAMPRRTNDDIDRLVAQWGEERPDLDLVTMARVARLIELGHTFGEEVSRTGASYGISIAEGDILFALRPSGAPYRLGPPPLSLPPRPVRSLRGAAGSGGHPAQPPRPPRGARRDPPRAPPGRPPQHGGPAHRRGARARRSGGHASRRQRAAAAGAP